MNVLITTLRVRLDRLPARSFTLKLSARLPLAVGASKGAFKLSRLLSLSADMETSLMLFMRFCEV
jgi:hypothetical protein